MVQESTMEPIASCLGDPRDNELVITIKTLWPDTNEDNQAVYDWDNVKVYLNGKELGVEKFELIMDRGVDAEGKVRRPAPTIRINDW